MIACRRDTFGESKTTVLFGPLPIEQLPIMGNLSPAVSSQAPCTSSFSMRVVGGPPRGVSSSAAMIKDCIGSRWQYRQEKPPPKARLFYLGLYFWSRYG